MSKFNNHKIKEELIRRYYSGDYDQSISSEVFDEFGSILVKECGEVECRAIFEQLWNEQQGEISDERKREVLKKIIERIEREGGFTLRSAANNSATKMSLRRVISRVAAVVVPVMISAGGVWLFNHGGDREESAGVVPTIVELIAQRGETKDAVLPDSSKVWINSDSRVVFSTGDNEPRLANLEGECYFDVAKDEKRQFVVETKNLTVTVHGTKFNIEAYNDRRLTIVTLDQGSLSVNLPSGVEHKITPGQQLVYNNALGKAKIIATGESDEYLMSKWRSGSRMCYEMTLGEVFNAIERKYNYKVNITDSTVLSSDKAYNAVFTDKDSPADILQVIRFMSGESFDHSVDGEVITIK